MPAAPNPFPHAHAAWRRRVLKIAAVFLVLLLAALIFWMRTGLYHRFVQFPRRQAAWETLRAQRQPVAEDAGWREFRGILHSHSHLSHDSEVPFEAILEALKRADLDFICLSDHCADSLANFDSQWRGLHDGKLFVPGFEMRDGFMPFGVAAGTVLSNQMDSAALARSVVDHRGVLFFAHSEEPREWTRPELTGMEIYNIHSDFKRHRGGVWSLLPDLLLNLQRYPDQIYWSLFVPPTEFLARWDELNRTRHLTGIAGNDCHQNVGFRGFYTTNDTLRIEDTSPKQLAELKLNWLTRPCASALFGPLVPGRKLFHVQLDPYERSARFVNTHLLARDLSEASILDALRAGRVFVAFDMIADSRTFRSWASDRTRTAVMGEAIVATLETRLHARSPLPCRLRLMKNGSVIREAEGRSADWVSTGPGKYRVEAELKVGDEWVPWIYANPIELQ